MDTIYPVNAVAGAPAYSGRMLRQANSVLLGGATAARPLGARSGVRPGTSTATVTATSTTWSCGSFAGVIDAQAAAEAGPYAFAFDAADGGALTAANASNPRIDIVYVQIDDPSESDGTTVPAVRRGYLAGVAAATPVAPAAPARSFVVAQINVPKSGGGSPTVTWVAPVAVAAGGILPVPTLALLNAITGYKGQYAEVTGDTAANNGLYKWSGSAWLNVYSDTGWLTLPLNSGFVARPGNPVPQYRRIGKMVQMRGQVQPEAGSFTSANPIVGVTPGGGFWPSVYQVFAGAGSGTTMRLTAGTGGNIQVAPMDAAVTSAYADLAAINFWVD